MSKGGLLMAKFWDKMMKMLVHANPQDFVPLISQETRYISDITNEQITRSIEADFLCNAVRNNQKIVVHLEFQRSSDTNMGKRMWEYNAVSSYLTQLPVCSFALYLWEDNSIVEPPYRLELIDGKLIYIFYYENIFLWEVPPEKLQQEGLEGLLPLLPLTKGAKNARDKIVNDMINGLRAANKENLLALGFALAGRVYTTETDKQWLKRRFNVFEDDIEDSWVVQEWKLKGELRGELRGELKALRPMLVSVVETRFPELTTLAQEKAECIEIPELLSMVINKLLITQTAEKAHQVLIEIDQVPNTPNPDS